MKRILLMSFLLLGVITSAWAQRTVSGKITDATSGDALPGVAVRVKGSTQGTVTDMDGNYRIEVPADNSILAFTYVGYITQEVSTTSRTTLDIKLAEDVEQLSEVVVVGYQSLKKADLTTSVSTIGGTEIQQQPIGSIDNLLQGRSPGMLVTSSNGRPGGDAYIRIRGVGSANASNEPLFIVDGVQVASADYNTLNPNDVESINILKDAAATSIYGARASNGVIVITTKRGSQKKNKPDIRYSFQRGTKEMIPMNFEMMNKEQKLQYEVETGRRTQASADAIREGRNTPETDWFDELLREGTVQMHDLSLSNTTDRTNFYFALSSYDEQGIFDASDFSRYTGRFNVDNQTTDWLKMGSSLSIAHTTEQEIRDRNNVQNPFRAMFAYNPYEPKFVLDEETGEVVVDEFGNPVYNATHQGFPIAEALVNNPTHGKRLAGMGNFYIAATPIERLILRSQVGVSHNIYDREAYTQPGSFLDVVVGNPAVPGSKTDSGNKRTLTTFTNTGDYSFKLGENHNFNALIGTEFVKYNVESYSISGRGFPSKELTTLNNAAEIFAGNTARSQYSMWSQFGQMRYDFAGKYIATASLRQDASSRFGAENQKGIFWAASAAWNIADEAFMQGVPVIEQLKLRGSVGTSGNVPNQLYANRGLYGFGKYAGQSTAVPTQLDNPSLKWEENFNYTVGIDFGVLKNRVSGSVVYYDRTTSDLLFSQPLSRTTGWSSRLANVGEFRNSGVEAELSAIVVDTKGFRWSLFGSIATNKNEVVDLNNEGQDIINALSGVSVLREGQEINSFFLVRYAGVNPANGEALYYTKDGEVTNLYSADDAVLLEGKSTTPSYFGNFGTGISYKGLSLDANFYYQGGNYTYNWAYEGALLADGGSAAASNQRVDAFNYWKQPGDVGVLPKPSISNQQRGSDRYLQRGDFIRLRNVRLGYSLPQSLAKRAFMQNFTVYVQGTNLWTYNPFFSGDPEVGRGSAESSLEELGEYTLWSYPNTRGFTFGVDVRF